MSLRKALINSHIAAITVAMLVIMCGTNLVLALRETAGLALELPYINALDLFARFKVLAISFFLIQAVLSFSAAWAISRWAYGSGPIRCFRTCRDIIRRPPHV